MKRFLSTTLFGLVAAVLGGCPIYSDDGGDRVYQCNSDYDCPTGYACSDGACLAAAGGGVAGCVSPSQCAPGTTCGSDGQCHTGDCTSSGCPSGYQCKLSNGAVQCVPTGAGVDGGAGGGGDASTGTDSGKNDGGATGCQKDSDCSSAGAGAKCLNGTCVPASDQCWDGTQCAAGEKCVSGVCVPSCGTSTPCPTGYTCDEKNNVCTGNPTPCGSGGNACASGAVCVEQHCVPSCEDGGACPTGEVCVEGGCIPDQLPHFVCGADGTPGTGGAGSCAVGSLCLHHNCYIACTPGDGGAMSCQSADQFNVCTTVTVGNDAGSYNVCGSGSNLGSQCDATHPCTASGTVCIDGNCK